jgi:Immunity protein 35
MVTLNLEKASIVAKERLAANDNKEYYSYEYGGTDIMMEYTKETSKGWLFFCQSRKYIETKNFSYQLV